jgi:hypothetical protein
MEEEKKSVTGNEVEDMTPDYLAAINELKQNSVDRESYEKLKAENKKLLDSIVNGTEVAVPQEEKKSVEELRAAYLKEDQSNLEYITNALKLREALMAEGKPDPFLPIGEQILPTDEDVATANKVANILQECVDYAEGDSNVFTNELQRRLVDVKIR